MLSTCTRPSSLPPYHSSLFPYTPLFRSRDRWIVPTIFFGVISFGCSLGSTTAITFCVDSYRQYAGEALVTLNVRDRKSTRLNSSHLGISYAVFSLKTKIQYITDKVNP